MTHRVLILRPINTLFNFHDLALTAYISLKCFTLSEYSVLIEYIEK